MSDWDAATAPAAPDLQQEFPITNSRTKLLSCQQGTLTLPENLCLCKRLGQHKVALGLKVCFLPKQLPFAHRTTKGAAAATQ